MTLRELERVLAQEANVLRSFWKHATRNGTTASEAQRAEFDRQALIIEFMREQCRVVQADLDRGQWLGSAEAYAGDVAVELPDFEDDTERHAWLDDAETYATPKEAAKHRGSFSVPGPCSPVPSI